ncbi:MAG: hypothetical protein IJQ59_09505 [Bacteroidaceae bacterium]|nr:hypothetical protein [Bacteroidaceae bacterium]
MEFDSEKMKQLVDKIFGLREDLGELEGVIFAITEADKQEPMDWLEVYLRDHTTTCALLAAKRDLIIQEIARLAKELSKLVDD